MPRLLPWYIVLFVVLGTQFVTLLYLSGSSGPRVSAGAHAEALGVTDLARKVQSEVEGMGTGLAIPAASRFEVRSFDLEVNFLVKPTGMGGQPEYRIVAVDGASQAATENAHRLTLHMTVPQPKSQAAPSSGQTKAAGGSTKR
jgi:hypothetical protein